MNMLNLVIITIFSIIVYYMSIHKKECNNVHYVPIYDYKESRDKSDDKIDIEVGEDKIPVNNLVDNYEPISIINPLFTHDV